MTEQHWYTGRAIVPDGIYEVGEDGLEVRWLDGTTEVYAVGSRVVFSSSASRQPSHLVGRLLRVGLRGPDFEVPAREPHR